MRLQTSCCPAVCLHKTSSSSGWQATEDPTRFTHKCQRLLTRKVCKGRIFVKRLHLVSRFRLVLEPCCNDTTCRKHGPCLNLKTSSLSASHIHSNGHPRFSCFASLGHIELHFNLIPWCNIGPPTYLGRSTGATIWHGYKQLQGTCSRYSNCSSCISC